MKVWVYISRSGNHGVFTGDHAGFERARARQDSDNRMTLDEILGTGDLHAGGSEDEGGFWIDDGGTIDLYRVE